MKRIEILGIGCARCTKTEQEVRRAVASLGWQEGREFTLYKIENPSEIAARGILMTPGVIIDGKVVSAGKVPTQKEILSWLK
ncbi:MAG: thioredoxin family protein [bacterium]